MVPKMAIDSLINEQVSDDEEIISIIVYMRNTLDVNAVSRQSS